MGKLWTALLLLLLPTRIVAPILRFAGYRISSRARVGFSLVIADRLSLADGACIGQLNLIRIRRLILRDGANINRSNIVNGPLSLVLDHTASIGNRNKILRAPSPTVVAWGARLELNEGARITSDHLIDCTRSVRIGSHSILAGSGSQVWTHAYVHASSGPGRYRIDGAVVIGHNVYLGSRCIVNLGVHIAPASTVGAGAVVSKPISSPGLYVGAGLRALPPVEDPTSRSVLRKEKSASLCEDVFVRINTIDARHE